MSGTDDNFLARWSRRKQAVETAEAPTETAAELVPRYLSRANGEEPADAAGPDGPEAAEPLPRIEDLTPESDLSAFLRKGVPEALKRAAMRRMWALDPTIRDYVGPSEYAWNYNDPDSIPGFGRMPAGSALAKLAARAIVARRESPAAEAREAPTPQDEAQTPSPEIATTTAVSENSPGAPETGGDAKPVVPHESALRTGDPGPVVTPAPTFERVPDRDETAAASPEPTPAPSGKPRKPAALRHGRALPR